jgi:hypothetical protein
MTTLTPAAQRKKCHCGTLPWRPAGCLRGAVCASAGEARFLFAAAHRQLSAMEDTDLLAGAVIKSPADKKEYRLLRLPNGLSALLIHDPSINVNQAS